ncbi:MAG: hypothetical protein ACXW4C_11775, partial [Nitrospira sp.]
MELMRWITAFVVILVGTIGPSLLLAGGETPSQQPSAQERLDQVLDSEGGTRVYKDWKGNVESTITLPGGEHIITVQPPQGAGINLGPPLQLNNQTLRFPSQPPVPALPPPPDFPQRAR